MKVKEIFRKFGEKSAVRVVDPRSRPVIAYQPKLPVKVQRLIDKAK